ncbi:hypothetical protein Btru_014011 [Bulinus truncatus]|nr:hypothetical protein Btru_014011 [Bulinus truncatus]
MDLKNGLNFLTLKTPDVGQAISLCQLTTNVDLKRRNEDLLTRRKETAALREVWKSLHSKEKLPFRLRETNTLIVYLGGRNVRHAKVLNATDCVDRSSKSAPLPNTHLRGLTVLASTDTYRPTTALTESNQIINSLPNIPHAFSKHHVPIRKYPNLWNNKVHKSVPERPKLTVPVCIISSELKVSPQQEVRMNLSSFFNKNDRKRTRTSKEYDVQPEWSSRIPVHFLSEMS